MNKSKKQILLIIMIFTLIAFLGGATYAFFNYTRVGSANTARVGRISFNTNQKKTINLTNLFPIDPTKTGALDDATKVGTFELEIKGDTDYSGGIEYLVSSVESNITTSSGKTVPISLDVSVTNLGTSDSSYFTNRENTNLSIYKKLVGDTLVGDQMLLVGYIAPNNPTGSASGINGKITIKAYLDKRKVGISNTYDGTESDSMGTTNEWAGDRTILTTTEWNALRSSGASFKVTVEANDGIWVKGPLEEIMRKSAIMDNINSTYVDNSTPGINFGVVSSDTNGKGVYTRAGTENDSYPIMYYRGIVEDNNVKFANKCWKIIRTTDTGGVKLIYNGEFSALKAPLEENDYTILTNTGGMEFDATEKVWVVRSTGTIGSSSSPLEISFNVPNGDGYMLELFGYSGNWITTDMYIGRSGTYTHKNGYYTEESGPFESNVTSYGTMTNGDSIKITYRGAGTSEEELVLKMRVIHPDQSLGMGCDNNGDASLISLNIDGIATSNFSFSGESLNKSLAYNGYMWGTNVYEEKYKSASTYKYGTGFEYNNGIYTLTNAENGIANIRHYTCFNSTGICDGSDSGKIYYVYHYSTYYIEIENGKGVEEALEDMRTNTINSNAKDKIEMWYANNMTGYTGKIEDTIYCNDRSMNTEGSNQSYINNGWIANGGSTSNQLYYSPYGRAYFTRIPSLSCSNKNDSFTWKSGRGNQKLEYPVGMITADEVMLAGSSGQSSNATNHLMTSYLVNGSSYWTLSPFNFINHKIYQFNVTSKITGMDVDYEEGLRPVISLKHGTPVVSGTGTESDPYVIG